LPPPRTDGLNALLWNAVRGNRQASRFWTGTPRLHALPGAASARYPSACLIRTRATIDWPSVVDYASGISVNRPAAAMPRYRRNPSALEHSVGEWHYTRRRQAEISRDHRRQPRARGERWRSLRAPAPRSSSPSPTYAVARERFALYAQALAVRHRSSTFIFSPRMQPRCGCRPRD